MRVIVAEDDRPSRLLLGATVRRLGHDAVLTADGEEAWVEYRASGADLLLTDWMMPLMSGPELCRRIREEPVGPYTYVVVVTALSDREHALAAVRAGADDHLAKPVHPADLEVRLVVAARVTAMHTELLQHRQELWRLHRESAAAARTDSLTGLGNRLRMIEDLDVVRARSNRYGHSYWLALCDLDRFKAYNDRYGHVAGDEVLAAVGEALRRSIRRGDSVFRYGGEEFLAVFAEQSQESAVLAADRLRREVEALAIPHASNPPADVVTMTVGLAPLDASHSAERSLGLADEALYAAKAAGRNGLAVGAGVV